MNEHIERFNTAAGQYTTDRYPGRAQCMRKVLDLLEPQGADVVLDVGCGRTVLYDPCVFDSPCAKKGTLDSHRNR